MASITSVKQAVNSAAAKHGFRCVNISWEDAARAAMKGGMRCGGCNISDVRLWERTGKLLYTVRSENWNERLGYVSAADVALMTGNEQRTAAALAPTTLDKYLQNIGTHAAYAGVNVPSLYEPTKDTIFGIRFQTVFLPVAESAEAQGPPPATEFCTEVYDYQTQTDYDPKNLLLLATPQGVSLHHASCERNRLFFSSAVGVGTARSFWLEAEKSEKQVGGAQVESKEEALEAAKRGKATAVRIGPSSMGTRFNVQMLIQVPLDQTGNVPRTYGGRGGGTRGGRGGARGGLRGSGGGAFLSDIGRGGRGGRGGDRGRRGGPPPVRNLYAEASCRAEGYTAPDECFGVGPPPPVGVSNAARVSRGTEEETWSRRPGDPLGPRRDASQHGTITVTMYHTVAGGVPSAEDVDRACRDLDALYKQCPSDKRLVDCAEVTGRFAHCISESSTPPSPPPPVPAWMLGASAGEDQ